MKKWIITYTPNTVTYEITIYGENKDEALLNWGREQIITKNTIYHDDSFIDVEEVKD
jgi:hypothetical protein